MRPRPPSPPSGRSRTVTRYVQPYTTTFGPYYDETWEGGKIQTAEGGFHIPIVPVLVVGALVVVAYMIGKSRGKK